MRLLQVLHWFTGKISPYNYGALTEDCAPNLTLTETQCFTCIHGTKIKLKRKNKVQLRNIVGMIRILPK